MLSPSLAPARVDATPTNSWIDSLRGASACAVVLFHFSGLIEFTHEPYRSLTKFGWLGVPVFFVISGCVVAETAQRTPHWRVFLVRRWWRIYPPYLASLLVVVAVAAGRWWWLGHNDVARLPKTAGAMLAALTLTTDPVTAVPAINWVYWSLSYEIAFYLVVAATLLVPRWGPTLLVGITALALGQAIAGVSATPFFLNSWPMFALGASLAFGARPRWALALGCLATATLVVQGRSVVTVVSLLAFASIAWSRTAAGARLLREPVFSRIGIVSYSLYLLHVPIGVFVLVPLLRPAGIGAFPVLHILNDLLLLIACVAISAGFWFGIERPAHQFGRRFRPSP
jgi:peptidoglycan/LPS O-acetylase OafA/YrhL